jgi:hypothetical protein
MLRRRVTLEYQAKNSSKRKVLYGREAVTIHRSSVSFSFLVILRIHKARQVLTFLRVSFSLFVLLQDGCHSILVSIFDRNWVTMRVERDFRFERFAVLVKYEDTNPYLAMEDEEERE